MQEALARHDEILRRMMDSSGGYVFKTVGDAFCAAFSSAPDALEAALAAQRALVSGGMGRRVGAIAGDGWRCTLDPPTSGTATTSARL